MNVFVAASVERSIINVFAAIEITLQQFFYALSGGVALSIVSCNFVSQRGNKTSCRWGCAARTLFEIITRFQSKICDFLYQISNLSLKNFPHFKPIAKWQKSVPYFRQAGKTYPI